jgi:biotin transporter BioY
MWLNVYLCGWLVTAVISLVFANESRELRIAPPLTRGVVAVIAGALWPVLVVGILELACIVLLANKLRTADAGDDAADDVLTANH